MKWCSKIEIFINLNKIHLPMVKKEVLSKLIDEKKAAILRVLLNSSEEMYLKEVAQKSNVSMASTFRILQQFAVLNIIQRKEWKTSIVYSCEKNERVDFLRDLFTEDFDGLREFIELTGSLAGVQQIILHGTKRKDKANVLLLGENIPTPKVEEICKNLKERGFELTFLTLTKDQYEQMVRMGLYSGEKKILKG